MTRDPVGAGIGVIAAGLALAVTVGGGCCAGPGPRLFPVAPMAVEVLPGGGEERRYDTDGDGRADCAEVLGAEGVVEVLRYDTTGDGTFDLCVDRSAIPQEEQRHLILVVDSVPFSMVRDLWDQGRFRLFHPPGRVIAPFPVMTDVSLSEFFGTVPCPGVESEHFDGKMLQNGYLVYVSNGNAPWFNCVDYHLDPAAHAVAYLSPRSWYGHELRRIQELSEQSKQKTFVGYSVGTSAMGARIGRNGHQAVLVQLDRFCQWIAFRTRGRTQITLLSDHGHNLQASERIPLSSILRDFGYRVHTSLERPGDVVVPEFGMVTCAAIHTREAEQVARDVVGIEGIELATYCDVDDRVVVLDRSGRARISHSPAGFRYTCAEGDPLQLAPILEELERRGQVDPDGFVKDEVLMAATVGHVYPDVVYRLWRAFHGLIGHTPDVLVSVCDGWHCGSPAMSRLVHLTAAHGNLRPMSSSAFSMTTAGKLPEVVRMGQLAAALEALGVPLKEHSERASASANRGRS